MFPLVRLRADRPASGPLAGRMEETGVQRRGWADSKVFPPVRQNLMKGCPSGWRSGPPECFHLSADQSAIASKRTDVHSAVWVVWCLTKMKTSTTGGSGRKHTSRTDRRPCKMLCQTLLAIAAALVALEQKKKKNGRGKVVKKRKPPRYWVRPWIKKRLHTTTLYDLRIEMQVSGGECHTPFRTIQSHIPDTKPKTLKKKVKWFNSNGSLFDDPQNN